MAEKTPVQPKLSDLLASYLNQRAQDQADGVEVFDPQADVTPYEAGPVQPIDAKRAWEEAVAALAHYRIQSDAKSRQAPPHWPALVAAHEPAVAIAFCVGNFPQLVRNFHQILQKPDLTTLQPIVGRPVPVPALVDWSRQVADKKQLPQMLLALGALRLAKNFDEAAAYAQANDSAIPAEWRAAWDNEKAALAWHQGKTAEALNLWNQLEPAVPVLFNRGMAELFLGNSARARTLFNQVVGQLPEASAWHHLARLYMTLAQAR